MDEFRLNRKCSHEKLIDFGFEKSGLKYTLSAPLYLYKKKPVIAAEFTAVCVENYINYDVVNVNSDTLYRAYYDIWDDRTNDNVLKTVRKKLENVIDDMVKNEIITRN